MSRIGIFGGSFNPVHCGHVRMAVESREQLNLDRVDFVLSYNHPLKAHDDQLPFATRWHLLQGALSGMHGYQVSVLERILPGPSYTIKILSLYRRRYPEDELFFILGAADLVSVPTWQEGLRLIEYAGLAVVPRFGVGLQETADTVAQSWPDAVRKSSTVWDFSSGTSLHYLDAPILDISATDIRRRLLQGKSVASLVPFCVERSLGPLLPLLRQVKS